MSKTLIKIGALTVDAADYELPLDRTFRDAWVLNGDAIEIDQSKMREIMISLIGQERDRRMNALVGNVTPAERETWATQVIEARAVLADPTASTPMLSPLAQVRGLTIEQMAQRVLALSDGLAFASGVLLARAAALIDMDTIPSDYADDKYWT